jgi:molecular chaperone Hsp33
MRKRKLYGNTLKEQYLASARDRLYNFLLADGGIRGVIVHGTRMINEMRANHELGILETLALGRAYLGVGLMSADLKGNDRISLRIACNGPIRGLHVEANAFGEVRGFLKNVPIPVSKPLESFDLSSFFGSGILTVTRQLEDAKNPFSGQVELRYGNLAQDLAYYYLTSEQTPSAFNLSIKFDRQGEVTGAGGLFLQAMPNINDEVTTGLEERVRRLPSLGEIFSEEGDPRGLVQEVFKSYAPHFLAERRIEFMCHCNKERLRSVLTLLPIEDLHDILQNGPFPLEMNCHHCSTRYRFRRAEIQSIYGKRFPNN